MKIIIKKGEYLETEKMNRIAEINKLKKYNYKMKCNFCGCKYIFNYEDVFKDSDCRVICPQCNNYNFFESWFIHRYKKINKVVE